MRSTDDLDSIDDGVLAPRVVAAESEPADGSTYFVCERCYDRTASTGHRRTSLTCSHPDAPGRER